MLNPTNVQQSKEKILSLLKTIGPSLPVNIARAIGVEPLFAGAFLSELYGEKKLKMSDMKVGSSPLYYIEGQESSLEKFSEHLNTREKQALLSLQKNKILEDTKQTPVLRVALRAIKDFAIPVRVRSEGEIKLFWKYFVLPDAEMESIIEDKLGVKKIADANTSEKKVEENKKEPEKVLEKGTEIAEIKEEIEPLKTELIKKIARKKVEKKEKKSEGGVFSARIREYLTEKDIEIMDVISDKKKEFIAKIRFDIIFGKQEFFLIARDKKVIQDKDFEISLQRAQAEKMPMYFISSGELNKKAKDYLREWRNLIRFDRVSVDGV